MNNFKNKNWFSDDLLKPDKNNNYYYDFGTGKKVEREEVKKERDDFLEGFKFPETVIEREKEKENDSFIFDEPEYIHFPLASSEKPKAQNFPNYSTTIPTPVKYEDAKPKNSWYSYLGGDLSSDRDKETFLDGFVGKDDVPDRTKTMLYSELPSTYTHVTNGSQKDNGTFLEKSKEYIDDLQNFGGEFWKIVKDLPPHTYPTIAALITLPPGNPLRIVAGKVLESEVKKIHYGRNQYNVDLPDNQEQAEIWKWKQELANCHQFTAENGERYIKYVSPDGKREVIFNGNGEIVITADEDLGTYNYADPDLKIAHSIVDVLPWILYGNTPEDTTKLYERIGGLFNFEE